jgi:hypothetical protein
MNLTLFCRKWRRPRPPSQLQIAAFENLIWQWFIVMSMFCRHLARAQSPAQASDLRGPLHMLANPMAALRQIAGSILQ